MGAGEGEVSGVTLEVRERRKVTGKRVCTACLVEKPLAAFPRAHRAKGDGRHARCRPCFNDAVREADRPSRRVMLRAIRKSIYFTQAACMCGAAKLAHPRAGCPGFMERET